MVSNPFLEFLFRIFRFFLLFWSVKNEQKKKKSNETSRTDVVASVCFRLEILKFSFCKEYKSFRQSQILYFTHKNYSLFECVL